VPFGQDHLRGDYAIPIPENVLEEEEASSNIFINRLFFPFELAGHASKLNSLRSKRESENITEQVDNNGNWSKRQLIDSFDQER
jgi:hypothetical protein